MEGPADRPLGLVNPRVAGGGGRVCNYCYQNAIFQCLASLPWARNMLPDSGELPQAFWALLRTLVGRDEQRAREEGVGFIVNHGVEVNPAQFKEGMYEDEHGQCCIRQCDADEFFGGLLEKLYRRDEGLNPFNTIVEVQHFEKYGHGETKPGDCETTTHVKLIAAPGAGDLGDCIAATYNERNTYKREVQKNSVSLLGGHYSRPKSVTVTHTKHAGVRLPGPRFLAVNIRRVVRSEARRRRFAYFSSAPPPTGRERKDVRVVDIPLENFELDHKPSLRYNCTGVVCHAGEDVSAGHYVAYVRRGSRWFLCDDDRVAELDHASFGARKTFQPLAGAFHVPYIVFFTAVWAEDEQHEEPLFSAAGGGGGGGGGGSGGGGGDGGKAVISSPIRPLGQRRAQPCNSCAERDRMLQLYKDQVADLERALETQREGARTKDSRIEQLERQLGEAKRDDMLQSYKDQVARLERALDTQWSEAETKARRIEQLEAQAGEQVRQAEEAARALRADMREKDHLMATLRAQLDTAARTVARADAKLKQLEADRVAVDRMRMVDKRQFARQRKEHAEQVSRLNRELTDAKRELQRVLQALANAPANAHHVRELEADIADCERENVELRHQVAALRGMLHRPAGGRAAAHTRPATGYGPALGYYRQ